MATMRSQLLPDELQASIMNIFRVPLNILVVTGARLADLLAPSQVFAVTVTWFAISGLLQVLPSSPSRSSVLRRRCECEVFACVGALDGRASGGWLLWCALLGHSRQLLMAPRGLWL